MQPKPCKSRILNQFLLFVLPFTIVAVTVTSAGIMWTNYRHFQHTVTQDYQNIIKTSAGEIQLYMAHALKDLETLAWVLATKAADPYAQKMALTAFNQVNSEFKHVSLISPKGKTIASTRWNDDTTFRLDDQLLQRATAGQSGFSDIQFTREQFPYVSLAAPPPGFGKANHIIWGVLDLKFIWDVLEGITIGKTGHVYVMDVNAKYVAHRNIDQVLTASPLLPEGTLDKIRHADAPVSWFEKGRHQTFYCLGSYVPDLNWIVTLRQPTREIYYYLFRNLFWAGLITAIACVAAIVLGWYRIKDFLKPVETMHRQVQEIGAGNLDQKVTVTSFNEIGDLAMAFNDMTTSLKERIRKEIASAQQLAHAENLAVLGISASKVTHEVGNLLNNVGMATQVLGNETLSKRGSTALANMEKESARVSAFIRDFLKFAKPPELKLVPLSLDLLIREVAALHGEAAQSRGIAIDLEWPGEIPQIPADAQLIYQVFNNLIKNSTEAIEGKGRIRIRGALDNDHLAVTVKDNGTGIAPEHLERIFDPFFTTKGRMGTGLGMAIVQSTITAHRGTITCQSTPGKGTSFIIQLPLK